MLRVSNVIAYSNVVLSVAVFAACQNDVVAVFLLSISIAAAFPRIARRLLIIPVTRLAIMSSRIKLIRPPSPLLCAKRTAKHTPQSPPSPPHKSTTPTKCPVLSSESTPQQTRRQAHKHTPQPSDPLLDSSSAEPSGPSLAPRTCSSAR